MKENGIVLFGIDKDDPCMEALLTNPDLSVILCTSFGEIFQHEGYAVICNLKEVNIKDFDIAYRKHLRFQRIYLHAEESFPSDVGGLKNYSFYPMSHIYVINRAFLTDISSHLSRSLTQEQKKYRPQKFQSKKLDMLKEIHQYITRTSHFTSKKIADRFSLPVRKTQRYLEDINFLYNDLGYDYSSKEYYVCK